MITETFIDMGFNVAKLFFTFLPSFEWSVDSSMWSAAKSILDGVCYFLPLSAITSIVSLVVGLVFVRTAIGFIRFAISVIRG